MSEQGIWAFRPIGRHFWLVVAAVLTLAAGMSVALAASGSVPSAHADHCPGEDLDSGESTVIDGVTLTVTFSGDSVTVTADAPFTGTISVKGGQATESFAINISEAGGSQTFTLSTGQDVSHVCLSGQAAPPPTTDTTDTTGTTDTTPTGGPPAGTETEVTKTEVTETTTRPSGEVVVTVPSGEVLAAEEVEEGPSQLAFTGLSAIGLAIVAGAMLALGLGLRRASRHPE